MYLQPYRQHPQRWFCQQFPSFQQRHKVQLQQQCQFLIPVLKEADESSQAFRLTYDDPQLFLCIPYHLLPVFFYLCHVFLTSKNNTVTSSLSIQTSWWSVTLVWLSESTIIENQPVFCSANSSSSSVWCIISMCIQSNDGNCCYVLSCWLLLRFPSSPTRSLLDFASAWSAASITSAEETTSWLSAVRLCFS